jgi:hypothetical protein
MIAGAAWQEGAHGCRGNRRRAPSGSRATRCPGCSIPRPPRCGPRRCSGCSAGRPTTRGGHGAACGDGCDPIAGILAAQDPGGWWVKPGPGYGPKYRGTVWNLLFLDQLGADPQDERIRRACGYVLTWCPTATGGFGCSGSAVERNPPPSTVIHCLNGNLLRALIGFGYLDDDRVQAAIAWAAAAITGDDGFRAGTAPGRADQASPARRTTGSPARGERSRSCGDWPGSRPSSARRRSCGARGGRPSCSPGPSGRRLPDGLRQHGQRLVVQARLPVRLRRPTCSRSSRCCTSSAVGRSRGWTHVVAFVRASRTTRVGGATATRTTARPSSTSRCRGSRRSG